MARSHHIALATTPTRPTTQRFLARLTASRRTWPGLRVSSVAQPRHIIMVELCMAISRPAAPGDTRDLPLEHCETLSFTAPVKCSGHRLSVLSPSSQAELTLSYHVVAMDDLNRRNGSEAPSASSDFYNTSSPDDRTISVHRRIRPTTQPFQAWLIASHRAWPGVPHIRHIAAVDLAMTHQHGRAMQGILLARRSGRNSAIGCVGSSRRSSGRQWATASEVAVHPTSEAIMQHLVKSRNYLKDHGWEIPKKLDKNTSRGTGMLAIKVLVAPPEWHTSTQTGRDSDRHSCRL